jgi:type VI secretion system protein ImpG
METLLPYYERELTFLRRLSHDFAKQYPKVAGRLLLSGEACDDPHIERLIESFAFLTSRIHKKLDDDYPEITDSLLQVVYPQYLRPFPAASIAQFDGGSAVAQLTKAARISKGTMLDTRAVRGLPCRFRTAYDVELLPLRIVKASWENVFDAGGLRSSALRSSGAVLRFDIDTVSESLSLDRFKLGKLRIFLNGEAALVSLVREALFGNALGVWAAVSSTSEKFEMPAAVIQPVGFGDDEALLDVDARTHRAHQLLLEYFVFPEKFNFFDLDLSALHGKLPPQTSRVEIRIGLKGAPDQTATGNLLERVSKDNFVLGCTPIVNLFPQMPEPIRVTHTAASYPIIVDNRRPHAYEIYEIRRVAQVQKTLDGDEVNEFKPFYSIRHGESHDGPVRYWHASHAGDDASAGNYTMEISLVDSTFDPLRAETNTLSLDLLCTNRDLPSQLPFGLLEGDLFMEGGSIVKTIRMLRKPTRSYRFPRGRGAQWRLISHLSLNHLSLSGQGVDAIREMLTIYDIVRSDVNGRQIAGIVAIEQQVVTARIAGNPFPTFARGLEIRITVDETHYAGIGLFMFAQILDNFFGLYVHTNSFTQLVIMSKQSGQELIKCPARNGESILA